MKSHFDKHLIVMMSPHDPVADGNPFVSMLIDSLPIEVKTTPFSWWKAFTSRYQLLHIHWPDRMTKSNSYVTSIVKQIVFLLLIFINRIKGIRHVATIHNLEPHEGTRVFERWILDRWMQSCSVLIYLSKFGLSLDSSGRGRFIRHGDYSPYVKRIGAPEEISENDRILTFGLLRPYKGIERLIENFNTPSDLKLIIAGKPLSSAYKERLMNLVEKIARSNVSLVARSLSPVELLSSIARSEAILLPYDRVYNSGAVLMALTLRRPVIITSSPSMEELRSEVGSAWIYTLPANWNHAVLMDILSNIRRDRSERKTSPLLAERNWDLLGRQHAELYKSIIHSAS